MTRRPSLVTASPDTLISKAEIDSELTIVETQIYHLKQIAMQRLLTLDETRQLDILIKNSLLLRGKATTINSTASRLDKASDAELIETAQGQKAIEHKAAIEQADKFFESLNKKDD